MATPVLGAEIGYTLLWLILLSCIVKVAVQNELGRYTIATGETALEAFDHIPGPRFLVSWIVWLWLLSIILTMFSMGGMLGAMAEILNRLFPVIALGGWVWIVSCGTVVLVGLGRYGLVEKVSLVLTVLFSVLTVGAVALLFKSPQYFSWAGVVEGLSFRLPEEGFITAVAAFGITGMAATELAAYPYWCLEKGYARFAGPRDATNAWQRRARGWIRVMGVDVLNCIVIYTLATVAFYLLGAGILHGMGILPTGPRWLRFSPTCTPRRSAPGRCTYSWWARWRRPIRPCSPSLLPSVAEWLIWRGSPVSTTGATTLCGSRPLVSSWSRWH